MLVYLNGEIIPHESARIPVDDRGFLFADGVYEVARVYDGRPFKMDAHLARMAEGLRATRIELPELDRLSAVADDLLDRNQLRGGGATVYFQVTRGAAPRKHAFPAGVAPTVYVAAKSFQDYPAEYFTAGVGAIRVADTRWARCDIKSVALLPNVLANQAAHEAGAFEALFVRDGVLIEGSHSNLMGVVDGTVVTYPKCNYILGGITRDVVLDLARRLGIPTREGPILEDRLADVTELFLSGTTTEVMPITRLDGRPVADGKVGPITRRLQAAYRELTRGG
ncbi:MAG TPA: D-amino acid aminotransferase [Longimicrobiales bacterium]|nr:D-amino acid aminotransferase [Longimicrobiales bacterium]